MYELYPDERELLERKIMNNYEPEQIDDYEINEEVDQVTEQHELPAGYGEPEPIPDLLDSRTSETTERNDSTIRLEYALDKQAPIIHADFDLTDLLPSTVAGVIHKSSMRSQSDPVALTMMLLTATGGLLGSKVRVNTNGGDPLAGNLYLWLVGDTSTKKSKIAKKIMSPLYGVKSRAMKQLQEAIKTVRKSESAPEEKKDQIEELKNNQRIEYFESIDISEQGLIKAVYKQAPLQGLQIHLDEGSDFFNGADRYSGNKTTSGAAKTSLLRNLLTIGWTHPLRGSGAKADEERCIDFEEQTFSLTANIQQQFVSQILDIEEDSYGFAARHDVVLVTASDERITHESKELDPASEFMNDRLIPFCQSIQLSRTQKTDDTGNRIRYTLCEFESEAQQLYNDYVHKVMAEAADYQRQEIEPAFSVYLKKVGVRLGKLALLQHILEVTEGAKRDVIEYDFDFDSSITFSSANKRIEKPISKKAMQRAINCCITLCKHRQLVNDSTCSAPMKREAQLIRSDLQKKMAHVLDKLHNLCIEYGLQRRSVFIANTKGTKGMSRSELDEIINTLIRRGCIKETKQGRALMLEWFKPLRSARC